MKSGPSTHLRSHDAPGRVGVLDGSYPGGKSGAGIFQRFINLIPRHRILISAFAGHCGIVRNIRPAEHTIVIDKDPDVCQWWSDWSRTTKGRALEVRNECSITYLMMLGCKEPSDTFIFADPPYVLSERAHGKQYAHELTDEQHALLVAILARFPESAGIMLCGYKSKIYRRLKHWRSIDHQVPTRGGLQDERIWMNYLETDNLHDFRYIGNTRRERERIKRRQVNWRKQLHRMSVRERLAMLDILNEGKHQ